MKRIAFVICFASIMATVALMSCTEAPPDTNTVIAASYGGDEYGGDGACETADDCDDGNSCTADGCGSASKRCEHERICCKTETCTINEVEARRDSYPAFVDVIGNPCEHVGYGVVARTWSRDSPGNGWSPWTATGHAWGNHGRAYGAGGHQSRTALNKATFKYKCCVEDEWWMYMPQSAIDANNAEATKEGKLGGFLGMIPDQACEALCGVWGAMTYRLPNLIDLDGAFINNGHNSNTDGKRTENMIARAFGLANPLPNATMGWCRSFCGLAISRNMASCTLGGAP
jgi:hypothetical protein